MIYNMQCFIKLKLHDAVQLKQECIPVGCVPSAAVAVSPGGSAQTKHPPQTRHLPPTRHHPLGADPHWSGHPLDQVPHLGTDPRHCKACWDTTCNTCWDSTPRPPCGQTHTCKNITFATSLRTVKIRLIMSVLTVSKTFSRSVPFT